MKDNAVSLEAAIELLCRGAGPGGSEVLPLERCGGRVTAEVIKAPLDMPPWPAAKVDGYALAWQAEQSHYTVGGTLEAGAPPPESLKAGQALRVFTGAALPDNCSVVIKEEDAEWERDKLLLPTMPLGRNILPAGGRLWQGEVLALPGMELEVKRLELLSSAGIGAAAVYQRPRVGVLVSGSELQTPGQALGPGQIYNSNRIMYRQLLRQAGAEAVLLPEWSVPDDERELAAAIQALHRDCALLLLCGGSGRGGKDLSRAALKRLGAQFLFDGLELKPGHRSSAARLDACTIVNLPGPPPGGRLLFYALIRPLLNRLRGLAPASGGDWFTATLQREERPLPSRSLRLFSLLSVQGQLLAGNAIPSAATTVRLGEIVADLPPGAGQAGTTVRVMRV